LEKIKIRDKLPPMKGKVVLVLHGLGRTRDAMSSMSQFLENEGEFTALNVSYPSTMADGEQHAQNLAKVIDHLNDVEELDIVAHSLGKLVVRRCLDSQEQRADHRGFNTRIRRMVMLGAPNNGSQLARALDHSPARELIGVPGRELAEGWEPLSKHLGTPKF